MQLALQRLRSGLTEEAIQFFAVFSRFEFAVKRCGCVGTRASGFIFVKWAEWEQRLRPDFFGDASSAAPTLTNRPPRVQIVMSKGGAAPWLDWRSGEPVHDTPSLFKAIRSLRNNLFHGGKFPMTPVSDATRDRTLLSEAQTVVIMAAESCPTTSGYFNDLEGYPNQGREQN